MQSFKSPLVVQQWRRLTRQRPVPVVLFLVVWGVMNWYLRFALTDWLSVAAPSWGGMLLSTLIFYAFRADVVAAFLLLLLLQPRAERCLLRPQLSLTLLAPREIAWGSAALPIAILSLLNTVAAPIFYLGMIDDSGAMYGLVGWDLRIFGLTTLLCALLEDYLFAAITVLAFLHVAFDDGAGPLRRALRPLLIILLAGIGITLVSLGVPLFLMATVVTPGWGPATLREALLLMGGTMIVVFAVEVLAIRWLWRRCVEEAGKPVADAA